MITLVYDPDSGLAVRDGDAKKIATSIAWAADHNKTDECAYATENVFYAVRVLVKQNIIGSNRIRFKFKDVYITVDRNGRCDPWPPGFCDISERYLMKLL